MKRIKTYEEAVQYCLEVPKFTKKNQPEISKAFYQYLNVENKKATIIHVAGTNGKGSVCAFLQAITRSLGKTAATFTSPHLCDIRERIQYEGEMIGKQEFFDCFQWVMQQLAGFQQEKESQEGYHPSFFELLFFIAMLYFDKKTPEIIILETGMGGRLDATNVVPEKQMSIITEIGYDHMEYLGDSLVEIAGEKAGIIKEQVPVVYWQKTKEISDVIEKRAGQLGSPCIPVSKELITFLGIHDKGIDFSYQSRYYGSVLLKLASKARYQMENAAIAARAAEELWHEEMEQSQLQKGIASMVHHGRMEEVLPGVYLDGAHNVDGIDALLDTIELQQNREKQVDKKRTLLFSVVRDKQYQLIVKRILDSRLFTKIVIAPLRSERGLTEEELLQIFAGCDFITQYSSVKEAWTECLREKTDEEDLYVAGSLYLVGQIKELL